MALEGVRCHLLDMTRHGDSHMQVCLILVLTPAVPGFRLSHHIEFMVYVCMPTMHREVVRPTAERRHTMLFLRSPHDAIPGTVGTSVWIGVRNLP